MRVLPGKGLEDSRNGLPQILARAQEELSHEAFASRRRAASCHRVKEGQQESDLPQESDALVG